MSKVECFKKLSKEIEESSKKLVGEITPRNLEEKTNLQIYWKKSISVAYYEAAEEILEELRKIYGQEYLDKIRQEMLL